jgi:hypothetical protein
MDDCHDFNEVAFQAVYNSIISDKNLPEFKALFFAK